MTDEGYIKNDPTRQTSINGVYACGDNSTKNTIVANTVSMGTITGMMVNKKIIKDFFKKYD